MAKVHLLDFRQKAGPSGATMERISLSDAIERDNV
jgi:hypothetical protein